MNRYDILAWLFPNKCLFCGEYVKAGTPLCTACEAGFTGVIERNFNLPMGGKQSRIFKVYAVGRYEGEYEAAIKRFKFQGKTAFARKAGLLLYRASKEVFPTGTFQITCVPMEGKKRKLRGYNQAELLAKNLSFHCASAYLPALAVTGERQTQHKLGAKERKKNSKDSYRVISDVMGQNIVLVDDIITTGSTLCACARLLFQAGAASVIGLCAANTPSLKDGGRNEPIERVC